MTFLVNTEPLHHRNGKHSNVCFDKVVRTNVGKSTDGQRNTNNWIDTKCLYVSHEHIHTHAHTQAHTVVLSLLRTFL